MNRSDIVGLTLAEISLALLFSFILIFAPAYSRAQRELDSSRANKATAEDLQKKLAAADAENARLHEELENSRHNLRSVVTPSCVEINKATDWLFAATIRGADSYYVSGQQYSLNDLLTKYASALTQAKRDACIQRIRIHYGVGVPLPDYDYALRRIEEHFYTLKLGPE